MLGSAAACLLVRVIAAFDLQGRLTGKPVPAAQVAAVFAKDLMAVGVWVFAFIGNRIHWRGEQMVLRKNGTMVRG